MTNQQTNQFTHYKKIINLADENWKHAEHCKISNLNVEVDAKNYLRDPFGRSFHHFWTTCPNSSQCGDAVLVTKVATYLADNGFFISAVFFPVVAQVKQLLELHCGLTWTQPPS